MSTVTMTLDLDQSLRDAFLECVSKAYNGKLDDGIRDLMRVYVEKTRGAPAQQQIKDKVKLNVYEGDKGSGISSRDIEKIMLDKTDEQIEAARLDKLNLVNRQPD